MKKNITDKLICTNNEALNSFFQYCKTGINSPKANQPREYLKSLGLDYQKLNLGFNSGQFHHNKDEVFKKPFIELGVLIPSDANVREPGMKGYTSFGAYSIVFPLKSMNGNIINIWTYRIKLQTPKGEYLNEKGIYPAYPSKRTTRLFLTENILDCATIIQSDILENRDSVIALNEGSLTTEIKNVIEELDLINEIIIYTKEENKDLEYELSQVTTASITSFATVENDSINEMYLKYGSDGIMRFIAENKPVNVDKAKFTHVSDCEFIYEGEEVKYHINGRLDKNTTLLELDFRIESESESFNEKLDLINEVATEKAIYFWTDNNNLNASQIILELKDIKIELDKIRQKQFKEIKKRGFSVKQDKEAKQLLKSENLLNELNDFIGKSGIIGEEKTRLLLFLIASSYKFNYNLHAVVDTLDLNNGGEFINKIAELIPDNEQYFIDITSSRSFRYYGNSAINNRLIVIPDYSGVTSSNAISDLKRLQAKGTIVNDTPKKDQYGFLNTIKQEVLGHCSSIGACKQSKKYFENEPRTIMVGMDNSAEQIQLLMDYDCSKMSGQINFKQQEQSKELIQYLVRNIHPFEVLNPFSNALMLPVNIRNARSLTSQLHSFVSIVTLFHQHQRALDDQNRLIATKEDNLQAIDLFLDAIMVTIDELESNTRSFFDSLKSLFLSKPNKKETRMQSFEIQKALSISKSHANRFLSSLVEFEYIKREGFKNTGFSYVITNWDELSSVKKMLKAKLCDLK